MLIAGLDSDVITIESFEISPNPPQPGQNLTVTVKATASETIEVSLVYIISHLRSGF